MESASGIALFPKSAIVGLTCAYGSSRGVIIAFCSPTIALFIENAIKAQ